MNTQTAPQTTDNAVSEYRSLATKVRIEGALLTLMAFFGCLGLTYGCALAWQMLEANGELRLIPLFLGSFALLLVVVHRLGRTAEPIWIQKLSDLKRLGKSGHDSEH
jgi:hypothetical protein